MKLLVVEDEKIIMNGIVKHVPWEELGITELRAASNADEALKINSDFHADIVLTDIRMPGMDGLTMCRRMREDNADLQIILLTGFSDVNYLKGAIDVGVISFLEKPVNREELRKAILKAVRRVRRERRLADPELREAVRVIRKEQAESEPTEESARESGTIQLVKKFIEENYMNSGLQISEVAEHVYLTPTYLSSLFKKKTGMTIGQYITECRVERAKQLLRDPRYKFYDIAEKVGYNDENYFARTFRKKTGMTPSEYRETQV